MRMVCKSRYIISHCIKLEFDEQVAVGIGATIAAIYSFRRGLFPARISKFPFVCLSLFLPVPLFSFSIRRGLSR